MEGVKTVDGGKVGMKNMGVENESLQKSGGENVFYRKEFRATVVGTSVSINREQRADIDKGVSKQGEAQQEESENSEDELSDRVNKEDEDGSCEEDSNKDGEAPPEEDILNAEDEVSDVNEEDLAARK